MTPLDLSLERKKRNNRAVDFTVPELLRSAYEDAAKGEFGKSPYAMVVVWKERPDGQLVPVFYSNFPSRLMELGSLQAILHKKSEDIWE